MNGCMDGWTDTSNKRLNSDDVYLKTLFLRNIWEFIWLIELSYNISIGMMTYIMVIMVHAISKRKF